MYSESLKEKIVWSGPERDGIAGEWRRLRTKETYHFYTSMNIIRVSKSRRM
jgi:hypothetical protein